MKYTSLDGFLPPHALSGKEKQTPLLVAFSGGADSSALLFLLAEYAKQNHTPLAVAHVDHKLRGKASDADREFCRAVAERYQIPFYLLEADVAALAKKHRRGIEEQARLTRYEFFESLMEQYRFPLLATAHNADDNAETLLFHMARGSGLRGLCGIPPSRPFASGMLIRPLLQVSKADILQFCEENAVPFVTDQTNADVTYARNRLRHKVLPELEKINSGAMGNMTRLCHNLRQDESYINGAVSEFINAHVFDNTVSIEALGGAHPAIASRVVAELLSRFLEDVRAVHVDAVLSLARTGTPHTSADVGENIIAVVENGCLTVCQKKASLPTKPFRYVLHEGENVIEETGMMLLIEKGEASQKNQETFKNIYKKATTIRINFDRINGSLIAESRREGDVILSGGMHKRVKKLMCDRKIPLSLRNRLPLLKDRQGILWIPDTAIRDGAKDGITTGSVTLFYND